MSKPIHQCFPLKLASGLILRVERIGYPDEGIRFIVYQGMPFNCCFEVQLSRSDTKQLIAALGQGLNDKRSKNLPE